MSERERRIDSAAEGHTSPSPHGAWLVWLGAVLVSALICLAFYPGYMSSDSFSQLREARFGVFTNWHPPMMAFVWRQLDALWPGPFGMLVFHCAMLGAGLAAFFGAFTRRASLALGAVLLTVLTPVLFAQQGTIWKDVGLISSLALAIGLYVRGRPLVALLPLFYAAAVRYNGFLSVLPLFVAGASALLPARWSRRRLALALVLGVCFVYAARLADQLLVIATAKAGPMAADPEPVQVLLASDLIALSMQTHEMLLPESWTSTLTPPLALEELPPLYWDCDACTPFYADTPRRLRFTSDPVELRVLARAWLAAIGAHPLPYLAMRWHVFSLIIGFGRKEPLVTFYPGIEANELGIAVADTPFNRWANAYVQTTKRSAFFFGTTYLLTAPVLFLLALLPFAATARRVLLVILASGLVHTLPLYFIGPGCDFRYANWLVLSCVMVALGLAVLAVELRLEKKGRQT